MESLVSPVMTSEEALEWKARISACANQLRLLLFEGHERRAWEALGYTTWTDCLKAIAEEHRFSERHLWRLHAANETEKVLTPGSVGEIPEKHLRPLTTLEPAEQRAVWQEVQATAPEGKVTATHVETIARQHQTDERMEPSTPPAPEVNLRVVRRSQAAMLDTIRAMDADTFIEFVFELEEMGTLQRYFPELQQGLNWADFGVM
jgi:hypothetical protein